jgi:hypothetical protein
MNSLIKSQYLKITEKIKNEITIVMILAALNTFLFIIIIFINKYEVADTTTASYFVYSLY